MSTNYNILLKSEKKLKELILDYLLLVHDIHTKLWNDTKKYINDPTYIGTIFDNCERRLERSTVMHDELLDECIWTISKDDPRANHLRFIISIIYATKDISRACEYASSIAKIIVRTKLDIKIIEKLNNMIEMYLNHIDKLIKTYKNSSDEKFEKWEETNVDFEEKFEKLQKDNRDLYSGDEIIQYQVSRISRLMLSTIERLQSVFSSTVFTKTKTTTIEFKKPKK